MKGEMSPVYEYCTLVKGILDILHQQVSKNLPWYTALLFSLGKHTSPHAPGVGCQRGEYSQQHCIAAITRKHTDIHQTLNWCRPQCLQTIKFSKTIKISNLTQIRKKYWTNWSQRVHVVQFDSKNSERRLISESRRRETLVLRK